MATGFVLSRAVSFNDQISIIGSRVGIGEERSWQASVLGGIEQVFIDPRPNLTVCACVCACVFVCMYLCLCVCNMLCVCLCVSCLFVCEYACVVCVVCLCTCFCVCMWISMKSYSSEGFTYIASSRRTW